MKIQVGKYIVNSDRFCFWIDEEFEIEKGKNKGKTDVKRVAGYSTSLKNLLRSFRDTKVGGSDAENLKEVIEVLTATFEDMVELNREAFENDIAKLKEMSECTR